MRATIIKLVFKQLVKYLKGHPDLIPGKLDDEVIKYLAVALGV